MITEQTYRVEVEALEPVRVGGAPDPLSGQENPVAIVGSEATIPGSSLKGALRSEIERYLIDQFYDSNAGRWPATNMPTQPCMAATQASRAERKLIGPSRKYRQNCVYPLPQGAPGVCPACYLLGAQGLVGFVKVPFLWCQVSPDVLYAARIDRASGTAAQGANREYRLLPRGTPFQGMLHLLEEDSALGWRFGRPRPLPGNPDAWLALGWDRDQVLQHLLLERLQAIQYLGGYKSKGFGRVKVTVTQVT